MISTGSSPMRRHPAADPHYAVADHFRLRGLPGTFIVGRDGYIKARGHGPREWDSPAARRFAAWLLAPR